MTRSKSDTVMLGAIKKGLRIEKDGTVIGTRGVPIKGSLLRRSKKDKSSKVYLGAKYRYRGQAAKVMFHRLQAYTKFGDALFEKGTKTRHGDGGALDNSWDNINIGTHAVNMQDIPAKERRASCVKKLSDDQVREVLKLYDLGGCSYAKLGRQYGVGRGTIRRYVKRTSRAYVEDE